jgi:hypothetical protein
VSGLKSKNKEDEDDIYSSTIYCIPVYTIILVYIWHPCNISSFIGSYLLVPNVFLLVLDDEQVIYGR